MAGNNVRFSAYMDDHVTGTLGKIEDKFKMAGKSEGFRAIAQGVGIGAGISAFGLLGSGIEKVTGFLEDSVKAYQEEQDSVSRLGASLKANVKGWDGNTTAIEKTLSARMKLGFSDEDQRNSLAGLVGATHDVNKALDIQSTAMDLARFKRISLADASEALTKVEAGSYRVLKSLGIVLKDGATQQDALNAVQKVAMGQASEYADTDLGKLEAAQIKVNEAQEKWGKGLSHLEATLLPKAADAVEGFTASMDSLGKNTEREFKGIGDAWENLFGRSIGLYLDSAEQKQAKAARQWQETWADIWVNVPFAKDTRDMVGKGVDAIAAGLKSGEYVIKHGALVMAHPIVAEMNKQLRAVDAIGARIPPALAGHLTEGWDAVHNASTALGDALKNPIKKAAREKQLLDILQGKGSVGKELEKGLKSADPLVREAAQKLAGTVESELAAMRNIKVTISAQTTYTGGHGGGARHNDSHTGGTSGGTARKRALGGPVNAGEVYVVGDRGHPELFISETAGRIAPDFSIASRSAGRGGGRGGGGGNTLIINTLWPPTRQQIKAIYDELAHYEYTQPVSGSGNRF